MNGSPSVDEVANFSPMVKFAACEKSSCPLPSRHSEEPPPLGCDASEMRALPAQAPAQRCEAASPTTALVDEPSSASANAREESAPEAHAPAPGSVSDPREGKAARWLRRVQAGRAPACPPLSAVLSRPISPDPVAGAATPRSPTKSQGASDAAALPPAAQAAGPQGSDGPEQEYRIVSTREWKYIGLLRHGRWHGEGSVRWADGSEYEGAFDGGRLHGVGRYRFPDGHSNFSGNWPTVCVLGCYAIDLI